MLGRHQNVGVAALLSSSPYPSLSSMPYFPSGGWMAKSPLTHSLATHHHTTPHPPKLDTSVMSHALPSVLARVLALARAVAVTLVTVVVVVTSNCHNTSIRHHAVAIIAKLTEVLIES